MAYPRRIHLPRVTVVLSSDVTYFTVPPYRGVSHYLTMGIRPSCDPGARRGAALPTSRTSRCPSVGPAFGRGGEALGRARRSLPSGCLLGQDGSLGRARWEPWSEMGRQAALVSSVVEVAPGCPTRAGTWVDLLCVEAWPHSLWAFLLRKGLGVELITPNLG
jgi:hypothetical protein